MRNQSSYLKAYSATYFFMFSSMAALFPFFPLLLQSKGFNPSQVGFLMGSYDLLSIAGLLTIGHIYDKVTSPRLTILSIAFASATVLYFLVKSESIAMLIALTLLLGFFVKSPASLLDAMYGQTIKNPQESYGKIRLSGSLGFFIIALLIRITQWIQGSRPFSVFTGYAILMAIALSLLIFLPAPGKSSPLMSEKNRGFLKTVKSFPSVYWIGLTIAFLSSLSLSGHYTFFSLMIKNRFQMENVSGFWAIGPIFEIPLFFFSGFLIKKFKLRSLWTIGLMAGIVRMQVYSLATTLLPLYLIQIVHSLSFALNHLSMITLINRNTQAVSRGLAMSIFTAIGMGLSMFTGGIIGGLILQSGDFTALFQVFSVFPLVAIIVAFFFLKE